MDIMLLEWVFTATFLILVVLALRAVLGKRVSAGLRYALWAVVLLRLLVPVQLFTSPLAGTLVFAGKGPGQVIQAPEAPFIPTAPAGEAVGLPVVDMTPGTVPTLPSFPDVPDAPKAPAAPDLTRAPAWLGWVWLAGSGTTALALLLSNFGFWRRLRRARVLLEGTGCPLRVYTAAGLPSPCLFGLVRSAVYVTPEAAASSAMLRHVLAHEATHFRHGDHIWSLLRCAALAVHWWNPLVWLAVILSRRDGELACDEGALKQLGDGERAAYGNTLLSLVTAKPGPEDLFHCATTMTGDKKSLRERVSRIAQTPKRWLWAAVAVVLVTALACVCAFGQAEPTEIGDKENNFTPIYAINGDRNVLIEGLDGAHMEWSRGTDGGSLYLAGDLGYFCPKLAGKAAEGGAYCEREFLYVHLNVDDGRIEDGTVNGFGIFFTVNQTVDMVYEQEFTSIKGDQALELTDQEMVGMARALAELLIGAEEYYNSHSPQPDIPELLTHFPEDVSGVPVEVLDVIGRDVLGAYEQYLQSLAEWEKDGDRPAGGWPEFDDWRVEKLEGPWTNTVLGMDLEIWRINYEYHTPEPEKAKFILAGGMYVTAAGWFCNTTPDSTYYIFALDRAGGRSLAAMIPGGGGGGEPDGETQEQRDFFYQMVEHTLAGAQVVDPSGLTPDLNRNGVPETIRVTDIEGGRRLEIWEKGKLLHVEEGYSSHAGYNALFLYHDDGGDYLLRYHPYMAQGWCDYNYQLFTLENGRETVVRENSLEFSINIASPLVFGGPYDGSFNPNAIADFMNEINELLWHSVQLLNTDADLLDTFKEEGRLYDSLWWLDIWEPVFTRKSAPLVDNLRAFQEAMEAQYYDETPVVSNPGEVSASGGEPCDLLLTYQGRTKWFSASWEQFFPDDTVEGKLIDLNGDGKMEIVFSLQTAHGTGCLWEELHVFDAETLEEYDCSSAVDMVLSQVTSHADEERFYVSAPGLEAEIEKPDIDYTYNDSVSFEDYYRFQVENGRLYGRFGAALDHADVCYVGTLRVEFRLDSGKLVCAGFEYLTADVD